MMQQPNECENVTQQLQALASASWQQQVSVLTALKASPQLVKLIVNRNYASQLAALLAIHNPRTKLITTLSDLLIDLFSSHSNQLLPFANLLVSPECLLRLLASTNKVVSSAANEVLKSIIGNVDFRSKGKQIRFVGALEHEFLSSRNPYVREKLSLYFLLISTSFYYYTKETLAEFERKVVRQGLQDASEKVRANMKQIMQNIYHFEKENNLAEVEKAINRRSTQKASLKSTKISKGARQDKSLKVLNNSVNQSSILESFTESGRETQQRAERGEISRSSKEEEFMFYLSRLGKGSTWGMTLLAYQQLLDCINSGFLDEECNDQLLCETLKVLTPFLSEKRSKIYQSCSRIINQIFTQASQGKRVKIISYCQTNAISIIEQVIKNQNVAFIILPKLITLNPSFFVPTLSQLSVNVKVPREKALLLDLIVTNLTKMLQAPLSVKAGKRVSMMVRAMCQHVELSTLKEKEVSLAALAVISQLKSKYPEEVLTTLLCQSEKSLSKILQLAESIDLSLKTAIIDYINSLKNTTDKKTNIPKQHIADTRRVFQCLQAEILLISQQKAHNLNRLGELALTHAAQLDCGMIKRIISLLEFLQTPDLIMEYKILMEQLTKITGKVFVTALMQAMEGEELKQREFHDLMMLELLQLKVEEQRQNFPQMGNIVQCMIDVFRKSSSPKKRNMVVQIMATIHPSHLENRLTEDEMILVETYRVALQQEETI